MKRLCFIFLSVVLFSSCSTTKTVYTTNKVIYQSIRPKNYYSSIPHEASVGVCYVIDKDGHFAVSIANRSDKILTIDLTKSFFVDENAKSTPYYDPSVTYQTNTTSVSSSEGASVYLGSIASALNIGGVPGILLSGISLSSSDAIESSSTETTVLKEQPQISLAPHSFGILPKVFQAFVPYHPYPEQTSFFDYDNSNYRFTCVLSFSLDNGNSFQVLESPFYINALISKAVKDRKVNDAVRYIYKAKTDAPYEPSYDMFFINEIENKSWGDHSEFYDWI